MSSISIPASAVTSGPVRKQERASSRSMRLILRLRRYGPLAVEYQKRNIGPRAKKQALAPESRPEQVLQSAQTKQDDTPAYVARVSLQSIYPSTPQITFLYPLIFPFCSSAQSLCVSLTYTGRPTPQTTRPKLRRHPLLPILHPPNFVRPIRREQFFRFLPHQRR